MGAGLEETENWTGNEMGKTKESENPIHPIIYKNREYARHGTRIVRESPYHPHLLFWDF